MGCQSGCQPNVTHHEHKSPENLPATTFGFVGGLVIYVYVHIRNHCGLGSSVELVLRHWRLLGVLSM